MMQQDSSSFGLRIVAWLFILPGVFFAADTLAHVPQGEIRLHVGLLSLFVGIGLLRQRRIWRMIA